MQRSTLVKLDILNASQLDPANFYPAMMHQAKTIVRRIGQVADALKQNKKQWFLEAQKVSRKSLFKQL